MIFLHFSVDFSVFHVTFLLHFPLSLVNASFLEIRDTLVSYCDFSGEGFLPIMEAHSRGRATAGGYEPQETRCDEMN